jgi:hypothetical protein
VQPAGDELYVTSGLGLDPGAEPGGLEPAIVVTGHRGPLGRDADEHQRGVAIVRRHLLRGGDDGCMRVARAAGDELDLTTPLRGS